MRRSLDWLRGESQGNRRYAAVLILREMAENAPAVFNVHVQSFIEIIWAGLRDVKVIVREASVAALRVRQLPFPRPTLHMPFASSSPFCSAFRPSALCPIHLHLQSFCRFSCYPCLRPSDPPTLLRASPPSLRPCYLISASHHPCMAASHSRYNRFACCVVTVSDP